MHTLPLTENCTNQQAFMTSTWFLALEACLFLVGLSTLLGAQIYRFRYKSSPVQRQQTKWGVFGITCGLSGFLSIGVFGFLVPRLLLFLFPTFGVSSLALWGMVFNQLGYIAMLCIPISLFMAMLRFRLWEIDRIFSRALVYSILVALLILVYLGCMLVLQKFLLPLTQPGSDITLVASTLVVVLLFNPLRLHIQDMVDRHFYHRKYDAQRVLMAFSHQLYQDIELDRMREHMLTVVNETMQPTSASLWLRVSPSNNELAKHKKWEPERVIIRKKTTQLQDVFYES